MSDKVRFWESGDGYLYREGPWPTTLQGALEDSRDKWLYVWENNVRECGGDTTCALCQMHDHCEGCPVEMVSGELHCENTPFIKYNYYGERIYAKQEYEFLSLLLLAYEADPNVEGWGNDLHISPADEILLEIKEEFCEWPL